MSEIIRIDKARRPRAGRIPHKIFAKMRIVVEQGRRARLVCAWRVEERTGKLICAWSDRGIDAVLGRLIRGARLPLREASAVPLAA